MTEPDVQWGATHDVFRSRFPRSEFGRRVLGSWFRRRGFDVEVPPAALSDRADQWQAYKDDGDLFVSGGVPSWPRTRIEGKWLRYAFTSAHDWPHRTYLVCSVASLARATPRPYQYFALNARLTHAGIVDVATQPLWTSGDHRDHEMRLTQDKWCCPLELVRFVPLPPLTTLVPAAYREALEQFIQEGLREQPARRWR